MIRTITHLDEIYARLVNPKNETVNDLLDMVEGWVGAANRDR
jgi:hypothetical protein